MIGYIVKIGNNFYKIQAIDPLYNKEATGSVAASTTTTKDWNTYMQPLDGYIYFVEWLSIDGNLGFQLQFPKGMQHGSPRGKIEYFYFKDAMPSNPLYYPFVITPPNYPTFGLYNPTSAANNSDVEFVGQRWAVRKLDNMERPPEGKYVELVDYANRGIGQG